jgi:hypothetical protein
MYNYMDVYICIFIPATICALLSYAGAIDSDLFIYVYNLYAYVHICIQFICICIFIYYVCKYIYICM